MLVRGQHLEEAEKFARVFFFLIGNIPKHLLSQLVINGGGKLGIKLDGFILRCNHEPDGSHQFVMGEFPILLQAAKCIRKFRHADGT